MVESARRADQIRIPKEYGRGEESRVDNAKEDGLEGRPIRHVRAEVEDVDKRKSQRACPRNQVVLVAFPPPKMPTQHAGHVLLVVPGKHVHPWVAVGGIHGFGPNVISLAPGLASEDSKQVAGYFGEPSSEPVSFAPRVKWKVVRGFIKVEGQ